MSPSPSLPWKIHFVVSFKCFAVNRVAVIMAGRHESKLHEALLVELVLSVSLVVGASGS